MRRRDRVAKRGTYRQGLSFGAISFGSSMVLALATSVAVSRLYGLTVIGQFAIVIAPGTALNMLSSAQEQAALVREVAVLPPRSPRVTGLFAGVLTFSTVLTLVVAIVIAAIAIPLIGVSEHHHNLVLPMLVNLAFTIGAVNTCWNLDMLLSAFRAARQLFWIRLSFTLMYLAGAIGFSYFQNSVWGLVWATNLPWVIGVAQRLIVVRRFARLRVPLEEFRSGFKELPELVRFGIKLAPRQIAGGLTTQLGVWAISIVGTVNQVGAYNRASMLTIRFLDANSRIGEMLYPTLIERRRKSDFDGADRAAMESLRYATTALLLPAAAIGGAAVGVMQVFGGGFDRAADALAIVMLVPALAALTGIQGQVIIAAGRPTAASVVAVMQLIVSIVATALLTIADGPTGAALGWVVGYIFLFLLQERLVRHTLQKPRSEHWPYREMAGQVASYAGGFVAARVIYNTVGGPGGTVLAMAAATCVFVALLIVTGVPNASDRRRLAEIASRLPNRRSRSLAPRAEELSIDLSETGSLSQHRSLAAVDDVAVEAKVVLEQQIE